jgi:hypothetical protein
VRAVVGAIQVEAEEAELSVADGRLRLVLKGGGTVTLPQQEATRPAREVDAYAAGLHAWPFRRTRPRSSSRMA